MDDAEGEIALEPSNFKVLQVTQMGPYNILAALQESFDRPRMRAVTNAKEYEAEFGMKLGSLSVRVNKP
ncbi:MAG TPA: hypothetical protein VJV96_09475 [Candidatus Angelobacter sp.]|nr:hypothetical protein [Candidatus Angelobacter sp.]